MGRNLKDTFLSIDLDYWRTVTPSMVSFLKKVRGLKVPMMLCKSHEQMLRFVNQRNTHCLINVDYHADLSEDDAYDKPPVVECGTWVNSVKWRKKGTFVWVCPNKKKCYKEGLGRCDSYRDEKTDPFKKRNNGWHRKQVRVGLKHINFSRVNAVAFALSPDYLEWNEPPIYVRLRDENFLKIKTILPQLPFRWLEDANCYEPTIHLS